MRDSVDGDDRDDEVVGILWVHLQSERAFIYDIEMIDEVRGRGYGNIG